VSELILPRPGIVMPPPGLLLPGAQQLLRRPLERWKRHRALDDVIAWAAPTFATPVNSAYSSSGTTETAAVSWSAGDDIYVTGVTEDTAVTLTTPTATGLTFSVVTSTSASSNCRTYLWKATAGADGSGVTISSTKTSNHFAGLTVYVVTGSSGNGTPVTATGSTALTTSLTRAGANSGVINVRGDWNATNDVAVTADPAGGTVDKAVTVQSPSALATFFTVHWPDEGAAGTTSYGIGSFTGTPKFSTILVEIQGSGSAATSDPVPSAAARAFRSLLIR
jgi:hypothetical protein